MTRMKPEAGRVSVLPRRKRGGFSLYKVAVTGGLLLAGMLLVVIGFQTIQKRQLQQQILREQARLEELEARNFSLKREIEKLSDYDYIEQLARKYFGLVKEGETVFTLED